MRLEPYDSFSSTETSQEASFEKWKLENIVSECLFLNSVSFNTKKNEFYTHFLHVQILSIILLARLDTADRELINLITQ